MSEHFDIVVAGGGVAGLTAAALFGSNGQSVLCVDPAPPITERDVDGSDLRSTAFLQPSVAVLERAGVWTALAAEAQPLEVMRIVDADADTGEVRTSRDFEASDISELPFGWNLPNWLIRRELVRRLETLDTVEFRPGVSVDRHLSRTSQARVWLSDGTVATTDLIVAADGRASPRRKDAGIAVRTTRYGQKALAFAVTHPVPHFNVSTEIHRSGGPFTLVPLPDQDGRPSSAIVWMEDAAEADRLMALETEAFEAEMSDRSSHLFGPLALATRRSSWPIISQTAERFSGRRLALVAEAAHVVPPIGAQGLNMSLADLDLLRELSAKHPLGSEDMLAIYDRRRRLDVGVRVAGIDLLNRTSQSGAPWMRDLRSHGIGLIHDAAPIRKGLMKLGLGL